MGAVHHIETRWNHRVWLVAPPRPAYHFERHLSRLPRRGAMRQFAYANGLSIGSTMPQAARRRRGRWIPALGRCIIAACAAFDDKLAKRSTDHLAKPSVKRRRRVPVDAHQLACRSTRHASYEVHNQTIVLPIGEPAPPFMHPAVLAKTSALARTAPKI